jgi:hypothetical protein
MVVIAHAVMAKEAMDGRIDLAGRVGMGIERTTCPC